MSKGIIDNKQTGLVGTILKENFLNKVELLYKENSPEFIYCVTLYNLFKDFFGW